MNQSGNILFKSWFCWGRQCYFYDDERLIFVSVRREVSPQQPKTLKNIMPQHQMMTTNCILVPQIWIIHLNLISAAATMAQAVPELGIITAMQLIQALWCAPSLLQRRCHHQYHRYHQYHHINHAYMLLIKKIETFIGNRKTQGRVF